MDKKEVLENLINADKTYRAQINNKNRQVKVIIVGGAALILKGYLGRSTDDIDALGMRLSELIDLFNAFNINCNVNAYCNCFAENYEDRIEPIPDLETTNLLFYTLSLEDLIISKLFSGREKDKKDIESNIDRSKVDFQKLKDIVESEVIGSCFENNSYNEFMERYYKYIKNE